MLGAGAPHSAALGLAAGALALAARRGNRRGGRAAPGFRPGRQNLGLGLAGRARRSPQRRFYSGSNLDEAVTIEDLRAMAHRRLPGFVLEYLEGGGEDEASLARNIAALAEWRFLHRSMINVSRRDVSTVLFGKKMAIPVVVAPTGLNGLFWPHADLRLAEAAAEAGVPFAQSTMSNDGMSRVARVPGLRYWWQLYVFGPPEVRETLIERARNAGCEALIVTVDAQIYGNREWHKRTTARPEITELERALRRADASALARPRDVDPRHAALRERHRIHPEEPAGLFDSAHWIRAQMDRALSWDTCKRSATAGRAS